MKAAILERPRLVETKVEPKLVAKLEQTIGPLAQKHERRASHPRYWVGEFNGLWCDEERY